MCQLSTYPTHTSCCVIKEELFSDSPSNSKPSSEEITTSTILLVVLRSAGKTEIGLGFDMFANSAVTGMVAAAKCDASSSDVLVSIAT